jgi:hypothetical protein
VSTGRHGLSNCLELTLYDFLLKDILLLPLALLLSFSTIPWGMGDIPRLHVSSGSDFDDSSKNFPFV